MTTSLEALVQRCEAEQLHLSGAIQSFGALIRIDTVSGTITHVSANLADIVGVETDAVLGRSRGCFSWLQGDAFGTLSGQPGKSVVIRNIIDRGGIKVDGLAIQGTGCILVELERSSRGFGTVSAQRLQTPLLRVPYDEDELARHHELLTQAFREVTGYDRVMIYRFHDDWSGEVIAEATTEKLGGYLGLRFPASDIPAIARDLYMLNPSRIIPEAASKPVPVLGVDPAPPDLTWSGLRSVSPVHLEYLGHMGAGASFSVAIRVAGRLWGLVACHHLTARMLSPEHRAACVSLANAYSLGLTSHLASRRFQSMDSLGRRIAKILDVLAEHDDPLDGIASVAEQLRKIMSAQSFAMAAGDDVVIAGDGPDLDGMGIVDDWFLNESRAAVVITDHLGDIFHDQPLLLAVISGMAAVKARSPRSGWVRFYWFRPAQPQEVVWAGNPNKHIVEKAGVAMLSPRRSFEKWIEVKAGYSRPWTVEEKIAAGKFRTMLLEWL
ncbi:light-regulated signal transduction histidine kinase (bacteriophytochrome) [Skermanella aerolata]|uniref:GAF domain-containing protein n=1 Tax=Skermanella aerolata TaxID=393310 RepID=UPI003D22BB6B